jgi:hypothetical protein
MNISSSDLILGVVLFLITFVGSIAMVTFLVVRLPETYFHESHDRTFLPDRHKAVRWSGIVIKNLFGAFLLVVGIIMSIPGVPGQGFLTILLGIMFLDFPGKRSLEYRLVSRPSVLGGINKLRGKFDKPPLVLE